VEEEYQRKKKEESQANVINMKKVKDGNKSIAAEPSKMNGKDGKNPK
jgi:hypothetical protein